MSTIVFTGITGFLGRHLALNLAENDNEIWALVRNISAREEDLPKHKNIHYIEGELDKLYVLYEHVKLADTFIHFAWDGAGYVGRYDYIIQKKNIGYAVDALELAKKMNCKAFVFSGSQAEYGMNEDYVNEETICKPIIAYGYSKHEFSKIAQVYCQKYNIRFLHLRIFSVYGVGDRKGTLIDICMDAFNNGKHMKLGPCSQLWNYLYIDDFVEVVSYLILNDVPGGIYNIASKETKVLKEFVMELYSMSNGTGTVSFDDNDQTEDRKVVLNPDISKLMKTTGWVPHYLFKDGIKKMYKEIEEGV